jgi:copper(I)-binding protein
MKNYYLSLLIIISSVLPCTMPAALADESSLVVENAWIAEAPPVSKVMVAYMTITNPSSKDIEIVSAESAIYSSIEFHETIHQDGLARMVWHEVIPVAANSSVDFKRGGKHLMLFNPNRPLKAGDRVTIKFTTKNNKTLSSDITVKKAQH